MEIENVIAGTKQTAQTLYRANDYLDEWSERQTLTQEVIADLDTSSTPNCFYWTPDCEGSLPTICPDDASEATFTAKNHNLYTIDSCGSDICTEDDSCALSNTCESSNIDCSWLDWS